MASSARVRMLFSKFSPTFPEKWKGGRIERIRDYFKNIATDYKAAVRDMVQDSKDSPRKASVYLSLLGVGVLLAKTTPSELSFQEQLWHSHHDLLLLGDPIRNRQSDSHVNSLLEHHRHGTLRYTNCGLFSLIWVVGHDPNVDNFEARCNLVKPRWVEFHSQVVDVGVLGRWHRLSKSMLDYDVNVDEWDEKGNKRQALTFTSASESQPSS